MKLLLPLAVLLLLLCPSAVSAPILVIGGHSPGSQSELDRQARTVRKVFEDAGIEVASVGERELAASHLAAVRLAILPQNPALPASALSHLESFVRRGGRLLAFFPSSPRLCALLGLKPAAFVPRERFGSPATITFAPSLLPGLPDTIPQGSWNGMSLQPASSATRVLGVYTNAKGQTTGHNALTWNAAGFCFSHVLQYQSEPETQLAILTLAATAVPNLWEAPAQRQLDSLGVIGGYGGLGDLAHLVADAPPGEHSHQLAQALDLAQKARQALAARQPRDAFLHARKANALARLAYQGACRPRPSELRGVWIHNPYGIADWGWDKTVRVLRDNGFNAIFPNFLWAYTADCRSAVLPQHPLVAQRGDPLRQCLDACRKYGIELHVWKVCLNMGHRTAPELRQQMTDAKRTQKTFRGEDSRFLAPHLKENQDLEVNALLDLVRNYDVDGVHLDYIRYPEQDCDYSDSARQAFEAHLGRKVPNWPDDCGRNGRLRKPFNAWRRQNINALVERISRELHQAKPSIKLSAAVFGGWDGARESIAQDAQAWLDHGWLDFICPMNYTASRDFLAELTERQVSGNRARIPIYIGLGTWLHPDTATTVEQIELVRQLGADGFICFQHTLPFATRTLPQLARNVTSSAAQTPLPHNSPRMTATLAPSATPLLEGAFAFPEPVCLTLDFPDGFQPPNGTTARLLLDGHYLDRQPPIRLTRKSPTSLIASFIPPQPGRFRLEVSDDASFVCRTANLPVLSPEQVRQKLIAEGIPQFANNGLPRVAVWQHNAYGTAAITAALQADGRFDVAPLLNLKPETLDACDIIVIPQPRRHAEWFGDQTAATLHDYLGRGGAILVTHALAGLRNFPVICPHLIDHALSLPTRKWRTAPTANTTLTQGLEPQTEHLSTFVDITGIVPTPDATPFLTPLLPATSSPTQKQAAAAIAGRCGHGRLVAIGLGLGIAKGDKDCDLLPNETTLLLNALVWLSER